MSPQKVCQNNKIKPSKYYKKFGNIVSINAQILLKPVD